MTKPNLVLLATVMISLGTISAWGQTAAEPAATETPRPGRTETAPPETRRTTRTNDATSEAGPTTETAPGVTERPQTGTTRGGAGGGARWRPTWMKRRW